MLAETEKFDVAGYEDDGKCKCGSLLKLPVKPDLRVRFAVNCR